MQNTKNGKDCQFFSVYVLWCQCTNRFYVGVTRQKVSTRIRQHRKGKKQFIDCKIREVGWEGNWDYWIVEENIPSDLISEREQHWVEFFDCVYPNGYNKTGGGIGQITVSENTREKIRKRALERDMSGENNPHYGKKHTEEVKTAQSARMRGEKNPNYGKSPANKGIPHTAEELAKMSAAVKGEKNPFFGKHHTEEAKERNRQAHLGKPSARKGAHHTEETKAILREKALARNVSGERNPFFGKKHTEEAIERSRQAHLGKPLTEEHKAKLRGRKLSEETKARMSQSHLGKSPVNKGVPWSEEHKAKLRGQKRSEETKARMREKALAREARKRAAKENLAAAQSTPTNLTVLNDAVILK